MGPESTYQDAPRGANVGTQIREETPVSKSMISLEKAVDLLHEVIVRHESKLQPVLSPIGPEVAEKADRDPQSPRSDLANSINSRALAIYALARQLEELSSRVEL